jgi:plasmid stabilization system protein ParE
MRSIVWMQRALDDIMNAWLAATSTERARITKACNVVDRDLLKKPGTAGESRSHGLRIHFVPPLAVIYHFDPDLDQVTVVRVRTFRRRTQ